MSMQERTPLRGKAIVTGASGFIGRHVREALLRQGLDVVSLVRASSPPCSQGRTARVDYDDLAGLERLIAEEQPDYVFHVAGASKGVSYDDFARANVVPTQNLLEALARQHPGVRRFLHVSSLTAWGPSNDGVPKRETDPPQPIEHYGRSKLDAERVVERFRDRIATTIIRPGGVYGPADVDMFVLFQAAKRGVNLFYGNREKRMSAVYVDDVVRAIVDAAACEQANGRGYFVCDGVPYTWGDIQGHIVRAVGRRTLSVNLPSFLVPAAGIAGELLTSIDKKPRLFNRQKARLDAQQAWLCTHEAARRDFGYSPSVSMAEGTKRAYDWYVENGWL